MHKQPLTERPPSSDEDISGYAVINALAAPAYVTDRHGRIQHFNQAAAELWGRTPLLTDPGELFCGTYRIFEADGQPLAEQESPVASVVRWGQPTPAREVLIERPDGSRLAAVANASPLRNEAGQLLGVVNYFTQVTEPAVSEGRDRPETASAAATREAEDSPFRRMFDQATVGMVYADRHGRAVMVNDRFCEITGYSREALVAMAKPIERLTHPDDLDDSLEKVHNVLGGRSSQQSVEKRYIRKDGEVIWVCVTTSAIESVRGKGTEFLATVEDITGRRRHETNTRFLARASQMLGSSLDYGTTLASVADIAVPEIADWCVVDVLDADGQLQRLAAAHTDPDKRDLARQLIRRYPVRPDASRGIGCVLRTGETEWASEISEQMLWQVAEDEQHFRIIHELGFRSYIATPLEREGRPIGVLTLATAESGRRFDEKDVDLAQALAARAELAIQNAKLFTDAERENLERKRAQDQLDAFAQRQSVVANLGQRALTEEDLQTLFDHAVQVVADTLDTELCKVLQLLSSGDQMLLRAGVGWQAGLVGRGTVDTGLNSQAGYTLRNDGPVIVEDLTAETRFTGPPLLVEHGVVSGMSVIIPDADGQPWGVLGTHSMQKRHFTEDDVNFLESIAHILGTTIQRHCRQRGLKESEQRERERADDLAQLMESVPAVVFIAHDAKCEWISGNRAACELLGQSPGANLSRTAPPEERPNNFVVVDEQGHAIEGNDLPVQRAARGEAVEGEEMTIRYDDGTRRYLYGNAVTLRDDAGQPRGAIAALIDISDRKAKEQVEARLAAVLNSLEDAVIAKTLDGTITSWNAGAETMYGYSAHEMLGQPVSILEPPDRAGEVAYLCHLLSRGQRIPPFETRRVRKDGQTLDVSLRVSPVFDGKQQPIGAVAIARDITAQKQLQREVEQGRRFQQLAESIEEVFWLMDWRRGETIYVSPAWERVWGRPVSVLYANADAWLESVCADDHDRVERAFPEGAATGAFNEEYRIIRPDGALRWIHDRSFPIHDRDGHVYRVAGVAQDITDRKQADELVRQREHELAHLGRLSLMAEMASGLGHELNQPLTAISTYAHGGAAQLENVKDPEDIENARDAFYRISDQADRAGRIINGLRDFVRKEEPDWTIISLNELVHETVEMTRSDLQAAGVDLQLDLADDLPRIALGRTEIGQVLINLLRNAMEAMRDAECRTRRITIRTQQPDADHLLLTVCDTGPGLPPEKLAQMFEPFFTTKETGMGMGLSICRTLIEHHEGELWAENNEDQGLTVFMRLPFADEDE